MPRRILEPVKVFDAKAATGVSTVLNVRDFKHLVVSTSAAANSSLTFKFRGSSLTSAETDLTAAQAVDNQWDYVAFYDLNNPAALVTGDTGVTINNDTVANNTVQYLINTDHLEQFAVEVTSYTDGSLTAWISGAND